MAPSKSFIVEAGTTVIGTVSFTGWDHGMAVAFGMFHPNGDYMPGEHATVLEGRELPNSDRLRITWTDGKPLACDAVGLLDYATTAGDDAREVTAFGVRDTAFFNGS